MTLISSVRLTAVTRALTTEPGAGHTTAVPQYCNEYYNYPTGEHSVSRLSCVVCALVCEGCEGEPSTAMEATVHHSQCHYSIIDQDSKYAVGKVKFRISAFRIPHAIGTAMSELCRPKAAAPLMSLRHLGELHAHAPLQPSTRFNVWHTRQPMASHRLNHETRRFHHQRHASPPKARSIVLYHGTITPSCDDHLCD